MWGGRTRGPGIVQGEALSPRQRHVCEQSAPKPTAVLPTSPPSLPRGRAPCSPEPSSSSTPTLPCCATAALSLLQLPRFCRHSLLVPSLTLPTQQGGDFTCIASHHTRCCHQRYFPPLPFPSLSLFLWLVLESVLTVSLFCPQLSEPQPDCLFVDGERSSVSSTPNSNVSEGRVGVMGDL